MRVLVDIGEVGLESPDRSIILRPSLYAMSRIGTPSEIVSVFARIHSMPPVFEVYEGMRTGLAMATIDENRRRIKQHWSEVFWSAWSVLAACSESDITDFIGTPGARLGSYRPGYLLTEDIITLARSLMKHGVIGIAPPKFPEDEPASPGTFTEEFKAAEFVGLAMGHLNMSEDEAWNMTMTSFTGAMKAKFGENKEARISKEHDDTMAWLSKVNAKRDTN